MMARRSSPRLHGLAEDEAMARREVIATAQDMSRRGLTPGRSGNVSRRWAGGMLVTPSGMAYDALRQADIAFVDANGAPSGPRKPSSEWRLHLSVYAARADVEAVVHTHSMHAVVLSCVSRPIPPFHYMVAVAGGEDIPCVPYATFGTEALANFVVKGLKKRDACLMAHHGQIAVGRSLAAALELAAEVETLAEQYWKVLALGKPALLSPAQMAEALVRFGSYGQKAQD